ncbi:hypothetical protein B296_00029099 [Ensete ventricosum]|uniref:Uncharacterized protein n=1 Tax=Ensete ventricosum TaxID=4639 RepID=A0A426ZHG2_ENSVE|nr:hypothetical protein B296_00029099 [Ensete ventricosum]
MNSVHRATFRESTNYFKEKFGYTTIDLGISLEKKDPKHKEHKGADPIQRLESVRGHLVSFPLNFMCNEDLRPVFSQGGGRGQADDRLGEVVVEKLLRTELLVGIDMGMDDVDADATGGGSEDGVDFWDSGSDERIEPEKAPKWSRTKSQPLEEPR